MDRSHRAVIALFGLLGLSACATGQDSALSTFPVAGDGGQTAGAIVGEVILAEGAPHLLAVSGTALLPGSRRPTGTLLAMNTPGPITGAPVLATRSGPGPAASTLPGPADASPLPGASTLLGPAGAAVQVPGGIATAQAGAASAGVGLEAALPTATSVSSPAAAADVRATLNAPSATARATAALAGAPQAALAVAAAPALNATATAATPRPLSGVNGPTAGLLGARTTATLGVRPAANASLTVGGGATPQTAATRLVSAATGVVNRARMADPGAPVVAPMVGGVPNATQLGAVAGRLPRPPGL